MGSILCIASSNPELDQDLKPVAEWFFGYPLKRHVGHKWYGHDGSKGGYHRDVVAGDLLQLVEKSIREVSSKDVYWDNLKALQDKLIKSEPETAFLIWYNM